MGIEFDAPISEQIWDMKYRFKNPDGTPIDMTVEDTWTRIASTLAEVEHEAVRARLTKEFYDALEGWKFIPAGRIVAGAGTGRAVTMFNCFVMGTIPDSMDGIFTMLREAALTMQQGGGIGYDFSTIRPKTSRVKKLGADASGPLSFMDVWDAMCRTVMSAGSRRGAMMATMRCDHPDIEDFITAKGDAKRLRMFNLSVLCTDAFMQACSDDADWPLVHVEPPMVPHEGSETIEIYDHEGVTEKHGDQLPRYIHKIVKARDLLELILQNTYDHAEPGVIFIDRINEANNLRYVETIAATNPCGEQPLPPYGACLLGSINLARLVKDPFTDHAGIDKGALRKLVHVAVRMMDNVVDTSNFPLEEQELEAKAKRRIGLGVTGLADALAMMRCEYGSPASLVQTEVWMKEIDQYAYEASVKLAKEKGAFPLFNAEEFLADGTHASTLPKSYQRQIEKHGVRNALLTSIAPTGTISLYAGNVSSGVEPIFAYSYTRKVLNPDGSHFEETVEDFAVSAYRKFWEENVVEWVTDPDNGRAAPAQVFDPDYHLPDYFTNAQKLDPMSHVLMQAVCQQYVDSSISKTINVPEDISFEDFKEVYEAAYNKGCKGCTTYRPNEVTGSILSVDKPSEPAPEDTTVPEVALGVLPARPDELEGSTYKIKVGDQKAVYLTVNDITEHDGSVRPFEIFLRSSDPTHDEWMVALARMISAIMRRPYDASFIGPELKRIHSANTGGFQRGGRYQPSLVAAIGAKIEEHFGKALGTHVIESLEEFVDDEAPEKPTGKPCPKCGSYNIKHESGCEVCADCGHSSCS